MKKIKTTIVFTALLSLGFANFSCAVERQDSLKYWCDRGKIVLGGAASLVGLPCCLIGTKRSAKTVVKLIGRIVQDTSILKKTNEYGQYIAVNNLLDLGGCVAFLFVSAWLGLNSLETLHEIYSSSSSQKTKKQPEESLKNSAQQNKK